MPLYRSKNSKTLTGVHEEPFKLEKELQHLTEENLTELFGLEFVASEFSLQDRRIDTLAYNPETKSFVIIEYKRNQSFSVIDQGFHYLSILLDRKADFLLEYQKHKSIHISPEDIDWTQSKVLFLARSFTSYQQGAINFKNLPIELWEVTRYSGDLVFYNQIKSSTSNTALGDLGGINSEIKKISREVKSYTEDEYLSTRPDGKGKKIYEKLKENIEAIDPVLLPHTTKTYIAFRLPENPKNIFGCNIFANKVRIDFTRSEPKDFIDPDKKVFYRKDSFKNFHQHISSIELKSLEDVEYGIYLIIQAYKRFSK